MDSFALSQPPVASTGAATAVTETGATLNGTVNPGHSATTYHFDYGPSPSYGHSTPTHSAGSDGTDHNVSATITDLTAGVTYHFRLVATNAVATSNGSDQTFVTTPAFGTYASAVLNDSPAGYWRFDELSGTRAADQEADQPRHVQGRLQARDHGGDRRGRRGHA